MKRWRLYALLMCCLVLLACHKEETTDPGQEENPITPYTEPANDHLGDTNTTSFGAINSYFSVSASLRVMFSRGNLQYCPTRGEWRFALHQYDFAHKDAGRAAGEYNAGYTGWVDLFGWGVSGYDGHEGSTTSVIDTGAHNHYGPSSTNGSPSLTGGSVNYDWAYYNAISNGGNQQAMWRTLSMPEWRYLLFQRERSDTLRWAATVNGVRGLILLPDEWDFGNGLSFYRVLPSDSLEFRISATQWVEYQSQGAVFLPAAGTREESKVMYPGLSGNYWSTTCDPNDEEYARYVIFDKHTVDTLAYYRYCGMSVRPVYRVY